MSGEFEAIGDAITGGVVGRAVEPVAGEGDGHTHESACLNCGTVLAGPFCGQCGQHAHVHRTLGAFFHDLLHGVFHFEGKIWRTLPLLALRPGKLTREYIDGRRASYVSPIALFLFSVFLLFAVMSLTGTTFAGDVNEMRAGAAKELTKDRAKLAKLDEERARRIAAKQSVEKVDERRAELQADIQSGQAIATGQVAPAQFELEGISELPGWMSGSISKAAKNPELVFYKLKSNAYKFSWALIPISVPFVWLLFPFSRRFHLYDHTVFVTYSLCFMMLLLIASTLVGLVSEAVANLAWFVPPFHIYRQLRETYALGKGAAIWRAALLSVFAFMAIGLFTSLLVALGAFD